MAEKKVVQYTEVQFFGPAYGGQIIGNRALVTPVDHPDTENVTNGKPALTTAVVSYDEVTEQFETHNTLYVPA